MSDPAWRAAHADSVGGPYRFNWFVMDFTGFATNPKNRVAAYHDTWDRIATLPVQPDGLYWHYHVPPESGIGDQWSETWLSSNECNTILARRLLERGAFPAAFRAGGTIEDEPASHWLERAVPIDFSNRVSERSHPGADLFHFNWHGAPAIWGSYRPSFASLLEPGTMQRFVYRCIDLRSRYNELTQQHVDACFAEVAESGQSRVLSFFSHDNRDMRDETTRAYELLSRAAETSGVPWESCTAVQAHRRYHGLAEEPVLLDAALAGDGLTVSAKGRPATEPFVAARLDQGSIVRLFPVPAGSGRWVVRLDTRRLREVAAAIVSIDGSVSIARA